MNFDLLAQEDNLTYQKVSVYNYTKYGAKMCTYTDFRNYAIPRIAENFHEGFASDFHCHACGVHVLLYITV